MVYLTNGFLKSTPSSEHKILMRNSETHILKALPISRFLLK